jgi:DNA-binding transcriptional MerR regulator
MPEKFFRTSDLAHAVGIHPNTVRLYEKWGLIPPVERSPSGYRLFTQRHLDCLRLARMIYAADYPGRGLRASGNLVIQCMVVNDFHGALEKAHEYQNMVKNELAHAEAAATLLENWAQTKVSDGRGLLHKIGDISKLLGVSTVVIRNWERDGLINIPRKPTNRYRLFGPMETGRLKVIRMLSRAGYSHMAILRMFLELDGGGNANLREVLNTPRPDEDVYLAADHWLSTLQGQMDLANKIIQLIEGRIAFKNH